MLEQKIPFDAFMENDFHIVVFDGEEMEVVSKRHKWSIVEQMSDVWGEANKCLNEKKKGCDHGHLLKSAMSFVKNVESTLLDPKMTKG